MHFSSLFISNTLSTLRMVQVKYEFTANKYIKIYIIQIYSGITCGRVLNGELYTCIKIYININIQRITMCPHGYHHNGFMATPALGTQEVCKYI